MHTRSSFISVQVWDGFSKEKHRPHLCQPLNSSRSKIKHILKEYPIQLPLRVVKVMSNQCQLVTIILGCHSRSDGDNVELRWWKSLAWKDVRTTSRLIRLVGHRGPLLHQRDRPEIPGTRISKRRQDRKHPGSCILPTSHLFKLEVPHVRGSWYQQRDRSF